MDCDVTLRMAQEGDFEAVQDFYWAMMDDMAGSPYSSHWEKDIYPADEDLEGYLSRRELVLCESGGRIVAAMAVNHTGTPGWENLPWQAPGAEEEITVIHLLGVHPAFRGSGIGKLMIGWVIQRAGETGQKGVRLDVMQNNLPAQRLYAAMGFQRRGELAVSYEDSGRLDFYGYEYPLEG